MDSLRFDISQQYKGIGASTGLDRGLLVYKQDVLLVEEGMGIGSCAIQMGGYTCFTSIKSIDRTGDTCTVDGAIDTKLEYNVFGIRSRFLTKVIEKFATKVYMRHEKMQGRILALGERLSKIFKVSLRFVKIPSLGETRIVYRTSENEVDVDFSCDMNHSYYKLFIMNELGGSLFDQGIINGKISKPPTGWQIVTGECELYCQSHELSFAIEERTVPDSVQSKIYWGRERTVDYCWAGFETEIICKSDRFEHYTYAIKFRKG